MKTKITRTHYLKYSKGHFPVVREKMPTPNKIKKDAEKILQGFGKISIPVQLNVAIVS